MLLLAITNHLSQNVAAIPFLWVLPLSIYLLTFILCFEGEGWYRRNPYLQLLAVALGSMAYAIASTCTEQRAHQGADPAASPWGCSPAAWCATASWPGSSRDPRYLTHFYLMISAGGALGGLLVGLVGAALLQGALRAAHRPGRAAS